MDVVVGLLVFAVPLWLAFRAVAVVPAAHQGVVERFGRCARRLDPGLHAVIPVVERVRRVDARARELVLRAEPLVCADNWIVKVDAEVEFIVSDAFLACTAVDDYERSLVEQVLRVLREAAGRAPADEFRTDLEQLAWELGPVLRQQVGPWGLRTLGIRLALAADPAVPPAVSHEFRLAPPPS